MNLHLARDALESVKLLPASAELWQRMCRFADRLPAEQRPPLIEEIASLRLTGSDANWLRCSALAYLTRDPAWLVRQSVTADAGTPPDAIMSLLGLVWYHALAR